MKVFNTKNLFRAVWLSSVVSLIVSATILIFTANQAAAIVRIAKSEAVAELTADDDGQRLQYPNDVFFDPVTEEIYVVNAGNGRVIVYGPDFFPRNSIGIGRGVIAPTGGTVMSNGNVYVCQRQNVKDSPNRITILNGAFFIEREIILDDIPEAKGFKASKIAVNSDGLIYLAGDEGIGVLVLDSNGNFLRNLQPEDEVYFLDAVYGEDFQEDQDLGITGQNQENLDDAVDYKNIPEEFRPRRYSTRDRQVRSDGLWPVRITDVFIDNNERLYLLSIESSKVYVYDSDENFLFSFGTKGGTPGKLSQPKAMAIDEVRGIIYIVDYMRHTILAYSKSGEFLFEFGGRGWQPGWFNYPSGVAVNNQGHVIVADLFNRRVQAIDVDLESLLPFIKDKLEPNFVFEASGETDSTESNNFESVVSPELSDELDSADPDQPDRLDASETIEGIVIPSESIPGYSESSESSESVNDDKN